MKKIVYIAFFLALSPLLQAQNFTTFNQFKTCSDLAIYYDYDFSEEDMPVVGDICKSQPVALAMRNFARFAESGSFFPPMLAEVNQTEGDLIYAKQVFNAMEFVDTLKTEESALAWKDNVLPVTTDKIVTIPIDSNLGNVIKTKVVDPLAADKNALTTIIDDLNTTYLVSFNAFLNDSNIKSTYLNNSPRGDAGLRITVSMQRMIADINTIILPYLNNLIGIIDSNPSARALDMFAQYPANMTESLSVKIEYYHNFLTAISDLKKVFDDIQAIPQIAAKCRSPLWGSVVFPNLPTPHPSEIVVPLDSAGKISFINSLLFRIDAEMKLIQALSAAAGSMDLENNDYTFLRSFVASNSHADTSSDVGAQVAAANKTLAQFLPYKDGISAIEPIFDQFSAAEITLKTAIDNILKEMLSPEVKAVFDLNNAVLSAFSNPYGLYVVLQIVSDAKQVFADVAAIPAILKANPSLVIDWGSVVPSNSDLLEATPSGVVVPTVFDSEAKATLKAKLAESLNTITALVGHISQNLDANISNLVATLNNVITQYSTKNVDPLSDLGVALNDSKLLWAQYQDFLLLSANRGAALGQKFNEVNTALVSSIDSVGTTSIILMPPTLEVSSNTYDTWYTSDAIGNTIGDTVDISFYAHAPSKDMVVGFKYHNPGYPDYYDSIVEIDMGTHLVWRGEYFDGTLVTDRPWGRVGELECIPEHTNINSSLSSSDYIKYRITIAPIPTDPSYATVTIFANDVSCTYNLNAPFLKRKYLNFGFRSNPDKPFSVMRIDHEDPRPLPAAQPNPRPAPVDQPDPRPAQNPFTTSAQQQITSMPATVTVSSSTFDKWYSSNMIGNTVNLSFYAFTPNYNLTLAFKYGQDKFIKLHLDGFVRSNSLERNTFIQNIIGPNNMHDAAQFITVDNPIPSTTKYVKYTVLIEPSIIDPTLATLTLIADDKVVFSHTDPSLRQTYSEFAFKAYSNTGTSWQVVRSDQPLPASLPTLNSISLPDPTLIVSMPPTLDVSSNTYSDQPVSAFTPAPITPIKTLNKNTNEKIAAFFTDTLGGGFKSMGDGIKKLGRLLLH